MISIRRHDFSAVSAVQGVTVVNPVTEPGWDAAILGIPGSTVFHTSAWSKLLQETYGFKAFYLTCGTVPNLSGVLPLMEVSSPFGRCRGIGLPFTDSCPALLPEGEPSIVWSRILGDIPAGSEAVGARLLLAARSLAEQRCWRLVEFRPKARKAAEPGASIRFLNHQLPLFSTDEEQRSHCAGPTRRTLQQAQRSALKVTVGRDLSLVKDYFELHCRTRHRQGGPPQPFKFFRGLCQFLFERNLGYVVLATRNERPIAGAVFLHFGSNALYKFGASDRDNQQLRPNQLTLWTGIRHAAHLGCTGLDLGRTSPQNSGLAQFKRGWGAEESQLAYHCFDVPNSVQVVLADRTGGWQTRWFKRLPVWVGRWVGQLAYRFAA